MPNYSYNEKYDKEFRAFYQDGRKETLEYIHNFLSDEITDKNQTLEKAIESLDYQFSDSIHDSIYCLPYAECLVILEFLTDHADKIETIKEPYQELYSTDLLDTSDLTWNLINIMRNWIFNGIVSMFDYFTDQQKTVKENIETIEKDNPEIFKKNNKEALAN